MISRSLLLLLTAAWVGSVVPAAQGDPVLDGISASLEPIVDQLNPKAAVGSSNQTLVVSYQAQFFQIPENSPGAPDPGKMRNEIGPGPKGFVLRVDMQDRSNLNPIRSPRTVKEALWQTDLEMIPVAGTNKQIFSQLSYGKETDPKLLAKIRAVLKKLAQPGQKISGQ